MNEKIKKLSLEEKARLLSGYKSFETYSIPKHDIIPIVFSDGPNGLRKENPLIKGHGIAGVLEATCFPSGVTLGNTWNKELLKEIGSALGKECLANKVDVLLGPAVNIKRDPRNGRNFEYYSEDPFLAGQLATYYINGVQSQNVGACIKHFCANNSEHYRYTSDSIIDERALHEIYLKPFEIAIKKSSPYVLMTSYNKINGDHASENYYLLHDVLRNDWKYEGLVISDWGGIYDRVSSLNATNDLEMPGMIKYNQDLIKRAFLDTTLKEEIINKSVNRLLSLSEKLKRETATVDYKTHYDLALQAGLEGAVLLKNEDNILPLKNNEEILIIGDLFLHPLYQGTGSALVNPAIFSFPKDVFDKKNIKYRFQRGYISNSNKINETLENEAFNTGGKYEKILYFVGQDFFDAIEGEDRKSISLPKNQLHLLEKLLSLKKDIIIVLMSGDVVELPFKEKVKSILYLALGGEAIGEVTYKLIYGEVSPSGRLSQTFMKSINDIPFNKEYFLSADKFYKESIYVGYRYYETANKEVNYPFGFGLSYSQFEYKDLTVYKNKESITLSLKVKNTGEYFSGEVIQLYIGKDDSEIYRAKYELKGFEKVFLAPKEEKEVFITLHLEDLEIYDRNSHKFVLEDGKYTLYINKSIKENIFSKEITLKGEKIKRDNEIIEKFYKNIKSINKLGNRDFENIIDHKLPINNSGTKKIDLDTPFVDMKSLNAKIIYNVLKNLGNKQYKKGKKCKTYLESEREQKAGKFVMVLMKYNSLRSLCFSSSGAIKYETALFLLNMINNSPIKAIKCLKKKNEKERIKL